MYSIYTILIGLAIPCVIADNLQQATPVPSIQGAPPLAYQHQDPVTAYVPSFPYAESGDYLVHDAAPQYPAPHGNYMPLTVPSAKGGLMLALRALAKTGLFLIGGVALLVIGAIFTTAVCSLTPICTVTWNGFGPLNPKSRAILDATTSYVTPENLADAAAFVGDAVQKYQRLQRAISAGHV